MISTPEQLADFTARLDTHKVIGLDTEADSLHSYREKICLVQVSSPDCCFLVDPLADLHLEPLWEAMDHHCIIFHAADYDLRLLFRGHHFQPAAIFDTMLAARLVGEPRFGLNDVLNAHLGITLEKGSQKANWGRRPLTPAMVDYALNDVRHLHPLRQSLQRRLEVRLLALVLPAEVVPLPDVRPTLAAAGLSSAALEAEELTSWVCRYGILLAEQGAKVDEVSLAGGTLLEFHSAPLRDEGGRRPG